MPNATSLNDVTPLASEERDLETLADEALEDARLLPHGPSRAEGMRKAGLLRNAAHMRGIIFAAKGRPRK